MHAHRGRGRTNTRSYHYLIYAAIACAAGVEAGNGIGAIETRPTPTVWTAPTGREAQGLTHADALGAAWADASRGLALNLYDDTSCGTATSCVDSCYADAVIASLAMAITNLGLIGTAAKTTAAFIPAICTHPCRGT